MRNYAVLLLAAVASLAHAAPETLRFYGYAHDLKTERYLYTEVHAQNVDGERWFGGTIKYYTPDGSLLASKTLDFGVDHYIPVFRLEIPRENYVEAITAVNADSFTMLKTSNGKTATETVKREPGMAADSGFHSAIVEHFAELQAGKTLKFRFGVAGQLDTYNFRCRKTGDTTFEGRPAVSLVVEPDSLLRLLAGPLQLVYEVKTRHLVDYRGISNMHDPATGKAYNVHIVYSEKPPADAPKNLPPLD